MASALGERHPPSPQKTKRPLAGAPGQEAGKGGSGSPTLPRARGQRLRGQRRVRTWSWGGGGKGPPGWLARAVVEVTSLPRGLDLKVFLQFPRRPTRTLGPGQAAALTGWLSEVQPPPSTTPTVRAAGGRAFLGPGRGKTHPALWEAVPICSETRRQEHLSSPGRGVGGRRRGAAASWTGSPAQAPRGGLETRGGRGPASCRAGLAPGLVSGS